MEHIMSSEIVFKAKMKAKQTFHLQAQLRKIGYTVKVLHNLVNRETFSHLELTLHKVSDFKHVLKI